jgi:hypothetical protein
VIPDITITHDVERGFISATPRNMGSSFANDAAQVLASAGFDGVVSEGKSFLIPKLIKLSMTLNVVHDHALGWNATTGEFRGGKSARTFPYDFGLVRDASSSPTPADGLVGSGEIDAAPGSAAHGSGHGASLSVLTDEPRTPGGSTVTEM